MSAFKTMEEINNKLLERNKKLLADAEDRYYHEVNHAIFAIHQAYTDLVCFGEKEVWYGDMMVLSAVDMVRHAETFYNNALELYNEAIDICQKK